MDTLSGEASVIQQAIEDDSVTEIIHTFNTTSVSEDMSIPNLTQDSLKELLSNRTLSISNFTGSTTITNLSDTVRTLPVLDRPDGSLSIQDQVIMGAAITVGFLAVLAIVLRFTMPIFRVRLKAKKQNTEIQTQDLYDEKPMDGSAYVPYTLSMDSDQSQSSSQSDQSQSSTQSDWSETSSNHTKSTYYSSDSNQVALWKEASFGNLMGSTLSLPVCLPGESGSLSRSHSTEGLNASLMTALSRKTFIDYDGNNILKSGPHTEQGSDIFDERASTQSLKSIYTNGSVSDGRSDGLLDRRSDGLPDRRVTELNPLFKQCYNNKYKANITGSKSTQENCL
ncbi:uncharacterized protein LOC132554824 [Ylistrum balloti]|uniref:uncharacterized protein LOC132554824 n=1 Tax=Ylistrum balloti TaxID=509963 RepID=UPI002905B21D|nr:uncharacterized protein LOC132554824 [Ylistrum balloti]